MIPAILRGILYHVLLYGVGFLSALFIAAICPRRGPTNRLMREFSQLICFLLLRSAGIDLVVHGREHLRAFTNRPVILLSNHVTTVDVPIQMTALGIYDIRYMYNQRTVLGIHGVGRLISFIFTSFGWFGVDPDKSISLKRCVDDIKRRSREERGLKIGLYPEGDRSKQGEINEFRSGAFYLAVLLGIPVIPILMQGVSRIHKVRTLPIYANKVGIRILPPIFPPRIGPDPSDLHNAAVALRRQVMTLYTSVPDLNTAYNSYELWQRKKTP